MVLLLPPIGAAAGAVDADIMKYGYDGLQLEQEEGVKVGRYLESSVCVI